MFSHTPSTYLTSPSNSTGVGPPKLALSQIHFTRTVIPCAIHDVSVVGNSSLIVVPCFPPLVPIGRDSGPAFRPNDIFDVTEGFAENGFCLLAVRARVVNGFALLDELELVPEISDPTWS